jgi:outer membrane protein OmpA-like peptidoglycan-associated protein
MDTLMKRAFLIASLSLCCLSGAPGALRAAEVEDVYPYAQFALPELQLGVGTRSTALGGASAALISGVESLHGNPAGLGYLTAAEAEFIHNSWIQEINQENLLFGLPVAKELSLAVGVNYLGLGTLEPTGITSAGDMIQEGGQINLSLLGISLGQGWRITPQIAVGTALRFYTQNLGDSQPMTFLADLGGLYTLSPELTLGLTVSQLGLGIAGYALPATVRLGGAYAWSLQKDHLLRPTLDLELLMGAPDQSWVHAGLEYQMYEVFLVRLGYQFTSAPGPSGLAGLTAGLGLKLNQWFLGYTAAPQGDLGLSHRLSIGMQFTGGPAKTKTKTKTRKSESAEKYPSVPNLEYPVMPTFVPRPEASLTQEEAAMRSLLKANLRVEAKIARVPGGPATQREVTFLVRRASGPRIVKWRLSLSDQGGKPLRNLGGEDLPEKIGWDGKNAQEQPVEDIKNVRYELVLTDVNNQQESQSGRIGVSSEGTLPVSKGQPSAAAGDDFTGSRDFGPILFERGRSEISDSASKLIAEAAKFIRAQPNSKVFISGYADSVDEGQQKLLLSKNRAEAVARYLTAYHKVPISRILVRGRGDKEPEADSLNPDERYRNRRVIITVKGRK